MKNLVLNVLTSTYYEIQVYGNVCKLELALGLSTHGQLMLGQVKHSEMSDIQVLAEYYSGDSRYYLPKFSSSPIMCFSDSKSVLTVSQLPDTDGLLAQALHS